MGGFIVLVYDSILIATSRPDDWKTRIERNFGPEKTNLKLKYISVEKYQESEKQVATFAYCGFELSRNRHGINWRLEQKGVDIWKEVARSTLLATPRTVFRLLGILRFAAPILVWPQRRIHGIPVSHGTDHRVGQGISERWAHRGDV